MPQKLQEVFPQGQALSEARVSRESNRISDVALLGRTSANGRVYTEQAMRDAARLYGGAKVFADHPTQKELRRRDGVRSVRDLIGKVSNPRFAGDRVRGDIHLLESEPMRSLVLSLAEQAPELAGMSHRARGEVRQMEDGTQEVRSLEEVFAVELVTEPATVSGLAESLNLHRGRDRKRNEIDLEAAHDELFGPYS